MFNTTINLIKKKTFYLLLKKKKKKQEFIALQVKWVN